MFLIFIKEFKLIQNWIKNLFNKMYIAFILEFNIDFLNRKWKYPKRNQFIVVRNRTNKLQEDDFKLEYRVSPKKYL